MKTVTLHDGRELEIDLHRVTIEEWRTIFDPAQPTADEDKLMSRILGLSVKEYTSLSQPDWRRATVAIMDAARSPLDDPNSASASTKDLSGETEASPESTGAGS